jgi:hypothetical protein
MQILGLTLFKRTKLDQILNHREYNTQMPDNIQMNLIN